MIKDEAKALIDKLSDDATWEDLMSEIYFKKNVDKGLQDLEDGKTLTHGEAKNKLVHLADTVRAG
jgi:predicted transcriptional regulator